MQSWWGHGNHLLSSWKFLCAIVEREGSKYGISSGYNPETIYRDSTPSHTWNRIFEIVSVYELYLNCCTGHVGRMKSKIGFDNNRFSDTRNLRKRKGRYEVLSVCTLENCRQPAITWLFDWIRFCSPRRALVAFVLRVNLQ